MFVVVKHTRSLGASEDLVVAAAEQLACVGKAPAFWFNFRPPELDARIQRLRGIGSPIYYHDPHHPLLRLRRRISRRADYISLQASLRSTLKIENPSRVVLNQGGNSDASAEAPILQESSVPYAVLCHAATESSWPNPEFLPAMRSIFTGASDCLFVSEAIRRITEAQLGLLFPRATVVHNPCKFSCIQELPWPDSSGAVSLAAVARLGNKAKGHDLILQTLALPQWRERPLSVTFYGEGPHRDTLESYAEALHLETVIFAGRVNEITEIWHKHHALIQASRYEGYGLSLLEAMFCQRMVITTPIPSATEFVTEGETGFMARAASVEELDHALERAWSKREQWRQMGLAAAHRVESGYPKDPVRDFINLIQNT